MVTRKFLSDQGGQVSPVEYADAFCRSLLHSAMRVVRWPVFLAKLCLVLAGCRFGVGTGPSTAFFYGQPVPGELFERYERVVVEADSLDLEQLPEAAGALAFAYLSVGEAERWRSGHEALPRQWFLGVNPAWNTDVADLTAPGWRHYLLDQRMAKLWQEGYRGFFLDTLDSYKVVVSDAADQQRQKRALLSLIREMHQRFPDAELLFNRGFELLHEVGQLASGVVAESLFYGWDAGAQSYREVSESDRSWLIERLQTARRRYSLPVTVIDYLPPDERELALEDAARIDALGFIPWIATPALDVVGIGKPDLLER
jgi:uncharacterized protein (TIGR01370 family)